MTRTMDLEDLVSSMFRLMYAIKILIFPEVHKTISHQIDHYKE